MFLKNLNPGLASEIKECWVDPNTFSVEHMIGQGMRLITFDLFHCTLHYNTLLHFYILGHFGTVWSGQLVKHTFASMNIAVKKLKGLDIKLNLY